MDEDDLLFLAIFAFSIWAIHRYATRNRALLAVESKYADSPAELINSAWSSAMASLDAGERMQSGEFSPQEAAEYAPSIPSTTEAAYRYDIITESDLDIFGKRTHRTIRVFVDHPLTLDEIAAIIREHWEREGSQYFGTTEGGPPLLGELRVARV